MQPDFIETWITAKNDFLNLPNILWKNDLIAQL